MKPLPPLNGGGARKAAAVVSSVAAAVILGLTSCAANADIEYSEGAGNNPWGQWLQKDEEGLSIPTANGTVTTDDNVVLTDEANAQYEGKAVQAVLIGSGTTAVVNGWFEFNNSDSDGSELILGRPGPTDSTAPMDLAALIINGSSKDDYNSNFVFDKGWLDVVNSDALISANGLTFTENGGEISVGPSYWAAHNYKIQKDGSERLLLGNFKDTYSSITSLDNWWASNKGEFSAVPTGDLKDGDFVISLKDFNIALNGGGTKYGGYLQANATPNNADGRMIVLGSSDGSFSLSGKSALLTSELYLANNAKITVKEGAHAFIGQSGYNFTPPTEYALTIGSENFKLGSPDAPSNGLIEIEGSTEIAGGEFYFQGSQEKGSLITGIKTTNDGDITGSAKTISLYHANMDAAGSISLSDTNIILKAASNKVVNNGGTNYFQYLFTKDWAALKAHGDIRLENSTISTGSTTGLYSSNGSIILDADTILTHTTAWDDTSLSDVNKYNSAVFYAKDNIHLLGQNNDINGLFHAITTDGNIKIFGKQIRIHPDGQVDNMDLLDAKKGNITVVALGGEDSTAPNLVLEERSHTVSNSTVIAGYGQTIRFHGDTGVNLKSAPISFGGKYVANASANNPEDHFSDEVTITALKGTISLGKEADIHTDVYGYNDAGTTGINAGGYGTINIYGQSVSADKDGKLTEGDPTDVAIQMDGNLYANTINIGNGVGHSKVSIKGKINVNDNTTEDTGYNINLIAGSDGLELDGATVAYGDSQGGSTLFESKGGSIALNNATIHDNGASITNTKIDTKDENASDSNQTAGTLLIQLSEANGTQAILAEAERFIKIATTTINDDIITINAAGGSVQLTGGSTVVADNATENEANNGLTVIGSSVSLADGSHFGNVDADGNMVGAKVDVQTSNLALDGTSYITSAGDVSIKSNNGGKLTIAMDQKGGSEAPSWIKGKNVTIGDGTGTIDLTGGSVSVANGGALSVNLGSGSSTFTGVSVGGDNQTVNITESQNANASLTIKNDEDKPSVIGGGTVNIAVGGTVSVAGQNKDDANLNSHIQGGNIDINAGKVDLGYDGWIQGNTNLEITAPELALNNGAHIGTGEKDSTSTGGKVTVNSNKVTVGDNSYITSSDEVSIDSGDKNLELTMTGSENAEEGWIKGDKVNISGNGIGITNGEILSTGEISINTGRDTEGFITDTNISGNTINFGGKPDEGNLGQIVVGGGSNITAGSNEGSSGQINIGTGVNVIVSNDGSLTANKGTDGETTSPVINVNGGKLTIDQGGEVTSEGNVDVTGGGSIDFTGTADPSTGVDAGKLVADGALNVGGDNGSGSVNVGAGQTGVIIAGNDEDGANVNIGNGGAINIGKDEDGSNQGSLIIGTGDGALPEAGENGGLAVGDNTTVNVNDGGTLVAGSITGTNNGSTEGVGNVHLNGGTLVTDKDTVLGGLGSVITNNKEVDSTFDMGNSSFTKDEIDGLRDVIGDHSTLVIGTVDGFTEGESISKDDLENLYGNAVANGAVIDTTNGGKDNDNTLTQGGGSQIQVSGNGDAGDNVGDGNLHIEKGENNGHVVITGSNSNAEQGLITGGTNSEGGHDIILGDGAHLTFGDSNSAGGVLDGNILLENGNAGADNVFDVVGGDFNVKGEVNIGSADIVIDGNSNQNGASLTVGKDVAGGSLTMQGTNASMDVGGGLNITGDANLSATGNGGHLITGGAMSVGGHLNVGEGMSIGSEDGSTDTSLEADSITMTGNGSIDRGPVVIGDPEDEESNGDLIMKDESSLTASSTDDSKPALDVNGNASIGWNDEGETGEHNPTLNVNGNGDISGNLNQGGGQINVADGGLNVGGDLIQDDGFITIDDLLDINGMLDQEKDGTIIAEGGMDVAGSAAIGGNVTVGVADGDDAKANFGNGLTVEPGGSFTNNSAMDGLSGGADTAVTGDLKVGEEGASETASATLGDATVSGQTGINNGNVTTGAFDAEGNVSLKENGHLSATGDINIGSGTDGNLFVDGGSTVSASANDASGNKGDITVAGSATVTNGSVSAEGALDIGNGLDVGNKDNTGSAQVASDSLNVTGDTVIWGNGSVEITQDALLSGGLDVNGGDFTAGGDLTVEGNTNINSGTVTADSSSITGDLVVGSANAEEGEEAIFNAGSAPEFAGNVTVEGNGQLNFSGATDFASGNNFIVKDNGSVNEGIDLPDGTSITVNGGFGLGTNGFVNAGDKFALGDESSLVDQNGSSLTDPTLSGFISASQEISFGSHEITFTGGEDADGNPILAGTNAHKIIGNVTYEDGAKHIFEKLEGHDDAGEVQGVVTIGVGGTLTTSAGFEGDSEKANLFVDGTITLVDETSAIVIGDIGNTSPQPGVAFGSGAALTIDGTNFVGGDSLFATANGSADIVVGGLQEGEKVSISMDNMSLANGETLIFGNMDEDTANQFEFDSNNILQDYFLNVTDGTGYLGMNLKGADQFGVSNDVSDVVSAVLGNKNENSQKQDLINQVFTEGTGWLTSTTDADGNPIYMVTEAGQQRIQDVLSLPIAAGAFNIAYDAMSEMNQTMANRMAEPISAHSVSVWADVIATYNSADELFGNSGYSADIYAAVMGADVGITEDWIAGVAFTIGQGDADGEGDTMGIQNDADFYGFSVYTAKNVGQLRFSSDMGYLKLKNDISTDVNYGGKGDTDVITVGARMDMTVHQGEQFDVTPHFGVRYANFNIDTINGTATNDINVVEVPLGVTVKGKTSMNGWKVAPMVDVSVVPQFGDKKAKIWNSGVAYEQDVLDSALVKTSVGVSAQKGNFTFGLNYRLGAGNDERQNHSFNANIRYQF